MKTRTFLVICAMFMATFFSEAQTQKEIRKQKAAEDFVKTLELVESGQFHFVAERAYPSGGKSVDLTSRSNLVEIKDENARGDLAFFGRATNVGYDTDGGGIKFDGEIMNKKLKLKENKNQIELSFSVKGTRDQYSCHFIISSDGSASLSINSNNRSTISYQGSISAITVEIP